MQMMHKVLNCLNKSSIKVLNNYGDALYCDGLIEDVNKLLNINVIKLKRKTTNNVDNNYCGNEVIHRLYNVTNVKNVKNSSICSIEYQEILDLIR